jgi:high-affinity K+ transport system ATPase subunit B
VMGWKNSLDPHICINIFCFLLTVIIIIIIIIIITCKSHYMHVLADTRYYVCVYILIYFSVCLLSPNFS